MLDILLMSLLRRIKTLQHHSQTNHTVVSSLLIDLQKLEDMDHMVKCRNKKPLPQSEYYLLAGISRHMTRNQIDHAFSLKGYNNCKFNWQNKCYSLYQSTNHRCRFQWQSLARASCSYTYHNRNTCESLWFFNLCCGRLCKVINNNFPFDHSQNDKNHHYIINMKS